MHLFTNKTLVIILLDLSLFLFPTFPQNSPLGIFKDHSDVGNVKIPGSVIYNSENQEYIIEGSGYNIWFNRDEFQYLWRKIKGDFILKARISFIGNGIQPHRKIGWMIRDNLNSSSPHVSAVVHGDGLTSLQFRKTEGAETEEIKSEDLSPDFIQLERRGNNYFMSTASHNGPFITTYIENINLKNKLYVGLFVCSHNGGITEKALFCEINIIKTSKKDY